MNLKKIAQFVRLLVTGVTCVCGGVYLLTFSRVAPPARHIIFPPFVFKPGLPGTMVSHTFSIRNDDDYPLKLNNLSVSCKCLLGDLDRTEIRPHESANLLFHMQLVEYEQTSRLQALLTGEVNGTSIVFEFNLSGETVEIIECSDKANYFDFGRCSFGGPILSYPEIQLRKGKYPLSWDAITCSTDDPGLSASLVGQGETWKLRLKYEPSSYIGPISDELQFHFWKNGKELPERASKPISVDVRGPVYANPNSWLIGALSSGETRQGELEFLCRSEGSKKAEIVSVEVPPGKAVEAVKIPGTTSKIMLTFTAGSESGPTTGDIVVALSDGVAAYKVRVSYIAFVMEKK